MDSRTETSNGIEEILELVNESDLSSIKTVLSGIIEIIHDPDSTAKDLTQAIQIDPPLAAKVLKVVNSPYYSLPYEVSDIEQAVILIGFDAVKVRRCARSSWKVNPTHPSPEPVSGSTVPVWPFWRR
jgi:HD-like signal output (HDOD) protein